MEIPKLQSSGIPFRMFRKCFHIFLDLPLPPRMQSSQMKVFVLGFPNLKMFHVIFLVVTGHPGWGYIQHILSSYGTLADLFSQPLIGELFFVACKAFFHITLQNLHKPVDTHEDDPNKMHRKVATKRMISKSGSYKRLYTLDIQTLPEKV